MILHILIMIMNEHHKCPKCNQEAEIGLFEIEGQTFEAWCCDHCKIIFKVIE